MRPTTVLKSVCGGATLALLLATSSADADIVFCNQFARTVFVAIAYPQGDGSWISRGWLGLATGECNIFDSAIVVKTFYFRGMTDPYRNAAHRRVVQTWGRGKNFAVWERDNFQYYNAEKPVLRSTQKPFTLGRETGGDDVSATVTFPADGGDTIVSSN